MGPKAGMMFDPNARDLNEYDLMRELAPLGADEDEIARMREEAKRLQGMEGPQMRDAGRYKVAANPLEHLAQGVNQYRAYDLQNQAKDRRQQLGRDTQTAVDRWIMTLRGSTADPVNTMGTGYGEYGDYSAPY